jgi:hypothetical protein
MGMTYLIAQILIQLSLKHLFQGELIVWVQGYKIIFEYDCECPYIKVKSVYTGIFLSNDLTRCGLPEWIDLDVLNQLIAPILKLRLKEMIADNQRFKEEERRERELSKSEQKAKDWEETKKYLNETFGLY